MDIFTLWDAVLLYVKEHNPTLSDAFSNQMFPMFLTDDCMTIAVTKPYQVNYLRNVYSSQLNEIISRELGHSVRIDIKLIQENAVAASPSIPVSPTVQEKDRIPGEVKLEESPEPYGETTPTPPDFTKIKPTSYENADLPTIKTVMKSPEEDTLFPLSANEAVSSSQPSRKKGKSQVNDEYTFNNFVYGSCNEFAYQSALSVAQACNEDNPDSKLNPLFIYGPSGLGKTHLLHAICNYVKKHAPNLSILFVTSETFTNDLITAIKNKDTEHFRRKYRTVDYLLIDDVQFFGSKDATKMEIFNTFNDLFNNKKHIIMTSDRTPSDIEDFEERLQSRFNSGLIVPISPPDYEICYIILQKRAEKEHIHLPDEVIKYIAGHINTNIRELEGAFNKITTFSKIKKIPITLDFVKETLKDQIPLTEGHELNADDIIEAVCRYFAVKKDKLVGRSRPKNIVVPRQIAMYLCRTNLDESFPVLAQHFNKKDHTTILHACTKIEKEIKENNELKKQIETIQNVLNKL